MYCMCLQCMLRFWNLSTHAVSRTHTHLNMHASIRSYYNCHQGWFGFGVCDDLGRIFMRFEAVITEKNSSGGLVTGKSYPKYANDSNYSVTFAKRSFTNKLLSFRHEPVGLHSLTNKTGLRMCAYVLYRSVYSVIILRHCFTPYMIRTPSFFLQAWDWRHLRIRTVAEFHPYVGVLVRTSSLFMNSTYVSESVKWLI